jgi:SAM-dependent methyltransferase
MLKLIRHAARACARRLGYRRKPVPFVMPTVASDAKRRKLELIRPLLRDDLPFVERDGCFDFLTDELRRQFNIIDTDNISAHGYDEIAQGLIEKYRGGLVLDCGAGLRGVYHENVVNFEIVPYPSTDVLGVGERLPFRDGSFDAVFSLNVLEHVKDPFTCAHEIARVMKPGADLYCVVPFLQALHGYPNHYYNMTHQGLRNLFEQHLRVEEQRVLQSGLPIWTVSQCLRRWADGLRGWTKYRFLRMRVIDLIGNPIDYLGLPQVKDLPAEFNFELASTTALLAKKERRAA